VGFEAASAVPQWPSSWARLCGALRFLPTVVPARAGRPMWRGPSADRRPVLGTGVVLGAGSRLALIPGRSILRRCPATGSGRTGGADDDEKVTSRPPGTALPRRGRALGRGGPSRRDRLRRRQGDYRHVQLRNQFTVQPDDPASCSFPISFDLQVHGSFQVLLDASGEPIRLIVHELWSGTGNANGNYVIEHAAQTNITDLVSGDTTNVGAIHDQVPFGGAVNHDVGILRFDAAGNLTFEAGQHQGFSGDPEAIAGLCAALA
jgi:hypothetical protein